MKENLQRMFARIKFPCVGHRTMKTVIVATLVSIVKGILGRSPCFACIGAVFGMGGFSMKVSNMVGIGLSVR